MRLRYPLRTLLRTLIFGPANRGKELWGRVFGFRTQPASGRCAYCGKERRIYEVTGPLGTGGVFVCGPCAKTCISITS